MRTNKALTVLLAIILIALFVVIFYFGIPMYRDWKAGSFSPSKGDVSIEGGSLEGDISGIDLPGEIEEYSCSWLNNCQTKEVPRGAFAITFKKVGPLSEANCNWVKLSEGNEIDYSVIDEFLVYPNNSIPTGMTLEDFVKEASKTIWACQAHATTEIAGSNRDTYYEDYSCSDMSKCQMVEVPMGTFTIGFTPVIIDGKKDCTTKVWSQGEKIDYKGIGEIHTYDMGLPMTTIDLFIESQKPFVASCN